MDLQTNYLGLPLKNPIVPSSSPLTRNLDDTRRLEDAGAAAIVMHSLFEEQVRTEEEHYARFLMDQSIGHAEADSFHPTHADFTSSLDEYLGQLQKIKQALDIPVIASLNGISRQGWIDHGKELQQAGADALELNVYFIPSGAEQDASQVEQRYVDLLQDLRKQVQIPISMKLSAQFSSPVNMVKKLEQSGANGVVLFNRFYQPDIDLETLQFKHSLQYSSSQESLLRIRWLGILRGQVKLSLAATGGFRQTPEILKALLVGADVTHLCSELLEHGASRIGTILDELQAWMQEREYESVQQLKGSMCRQCAIDPGVYEHANYFTIINSHVSSTGMHR